MDSSKTTVKSTAQSKANLAQKLAMKAYNSKNKKTPDSLNRKTADNNSATKNYFGTGSKLRKFEPLSKSQL